MHKCNRFIIECRRASAAMAAVAVALLLAGGARAAAPVEPAVHLLFTIPIPPHAGNTTGGMYSFDISYVDQATQTLYVADRSNLAIDVFDAAKGKFKNFVTATPPFAGASPMGPELSGPNGVVIANGCIIATDAGNRVVSFTAGGTQVDDIHIVKGLTARADELAFDPHDNVLLIATPGLANPPPPFGSLIKVSSSGCRLTRGKNITYHGATAGAEQPVWDKATSLFYQAIPQVGANPLNGEVLGIDPTTATIKKIIAIKGCGPAGNALNPTTGELLLGCNQVFDTAKQVWDPTKNKTALPIQVVLDPVSGASVNVKGVGASDEVAYNGNDNHFYTGSSGSPYGPKDVTGAPLTAQGANILGVIDGKSLGLDQLVPTFSVPAITGKHPGGSGHSVAANDTNGWVFVPAPANNAIRGCLTGCVQVFVRHDNDTD